MKDNVIVAHPQQQHSYRIASAMKKKNMLNSYITTVYYNEKKTIYKVLNIMLKKNKNFLRMIGRKNLDLSDEKDIDTKYEVWGIFLTLLIRLDKKRVIYFKVQGFVDRIFGLSVAKSILLKDVNTVIMFDKKAGYCFKVLNKSKTNILKILDMSSPLDNFTNDLLQNQKKKYPQFKENFNIYNNLSDFNSLNKMQEEIENSDYFIAASTFTKNSLIFNGVNANKIFVIPYGIDLSNYCMKTYIKKDKIRFLYTGGIHPRKGIISLLQAYKSIDLLEKSKLILAGQIVGDTKILDVYNKHFEYAGLLRKDQMNELYQNSDVFIQPSLHDGFSFSILEAMACGLPVICTENTVGSDVIDHGYSGFIVKAGDEIDLAEKIKFFIKNPEQIQIMGKRARNTAENFTWDKYEELYAKVIEQVHEKEI